MNIVVDIGHPAHVHLFRNFIVRMRGHGHRVLITAAEKDIAQPLLRSYGLDFISVGRTGKGFIRKVLSVSVLDYNLYQAVKDFHPDLLIGHGSIRCAHVAKYLGAPSLILADTEATWKEHILYAPFACVIASSTSFERDFGAKHVRHGGYHELAYLHPDHFQPDPTVLHKAGLQEKDVFFVIRFISWDATHDIGHHGFSSNGKKELVRLLNRFGRVFISSEGMLPAEFEQNRFPLAPRYMHDLLAYASLCVSEGATMASEAAVVGTPAVFVSTLVHGYIKEQENRYQLVRTFADETAALKAIEEMVRGGHAKREWQKKREVMLGEKIDLTRWMVEFVEHGIWGRVTKPKFARCLAHGER